MHATDVPHHPANSGRGRRKDCPSRRRTKAPLSVGNGALLEEHTWYVDCVHKADHQGLHADVSQKHWNNRGELVPTPA